MTAQPEGRTYEYEVRVFGYGDCDIGVDGPNFYSYIARRIFRDSESEAMVEATHAMRRVHQAQLEYAGDADEWCGVAIFHNGTIIWKEGWTWTDEDLENNDL